MYTRYNTESAAIGVKSLAMALVIGLIGGVSPLVAFATSNNNDDEPLANPPLSNSCGLDIALVLDNSHSISSTELGQMKEGFNTFIDVLSPATPTWFSVSYFNKFGHVQQGFTANTDTAHAAVNAIVRAPNGSAGTNWEDGLLNAASTFDPRDTAAHQNVIIFASDGAPTRDNTPNTGANVRTSNITAANTIKAAGTRIITIGIGNRVNEANMIEISSDAEDNGYYAASDFADVGATLAQVASDLCGGTITVHKVIDQDGDLGTEGDQLPGVAGWDFTVGQVSLETDSTGATEAVRIGDGGAVNIIEPEREGYTLLDAVCTSRDETVGNFDLDTRTVSNVSVNGSNAVTCTFYNTPIIDPPVCDESADRSIVSGTSTLYNEAPAVVISPNAAWTATIPSANWVWGTDGSLEDTTATSSQTFTHHFSVLGDLLSATFSIASDNGYAFSLNGTEIDDQSDVEQNYVSAHVYDSAHANDVTSHIHSGDNTLEVTVTNFALPDSTFAINPAGLLYGLTTTANECVEPQPTYTITVTQGDHGSIAPGTQSNVANGSNQTFTIAAVSGYHIADVIVDGVSVGAVSTHTFSGINANHTITASFAETQVPDTGSDLSVTKTVDDTTPDVGQQITYTITVTNAGPDSATGVTVSDVLPGGLTFVATSTADTVGIYNAETGVWTVGSLSAGSEGSSATLHITARVTGEEGQVIRNVATASVGQESGDPDEENNANDPSSASLTVNTAAVTPPVTPPSGGGGGGGGGGGCAPGFVFNPVTIKCDPVGQVLGASTVGQGQVLGASCGLYMDRYVKKGNAKNNAEQVTKLQNFLNKHGFGNFISTGFFGPLTEAAVKAFQQKYADEVLKPWNLTGPTGIAYLTTLRQVNLIECPELMIPVPTLVPWSANVNAE